MRLGRHLEGAAVLEDYASLVEPADADEAELVRREAAAARARLN